MDTPDRNIRSARIEMMRLVQTILGGGVDILTAVRKILELEYEAKLENNPYILGLTGIESQLDHVPNEEIRHNFSSEYLGRVESDLNEFEQDIIMIAEKLMTFLKRSI